MLVCVAVEVGLAKARNGDRDDDASSVAVSTMATPPSLTWCNNRNGAAISRAASHVSRSNGIAHHRVRIEPGMRTLSHGVGCVQGAA